MNLCVVFSFISLAVLMTYAAPQAPQNDPLPGPSDVESIERDIQRDQADQAALEPRNHAKRSYGYGGYYGGFGGYGGYPYYGFGYPYRVYYGGFGHGYGGYGGLYGGYGGYGHGYYF